MIRPLRSLPILWQTLMLVTISLLASAVVNITLAWALPMPRLDFYSMRDITEALATAQRDPAARLRDPLLRITTSYEPPRAHDDLRSHPTLTALLARGLGVPPDQVRLLYRADQSNFPFRYRTDDAGVPLRLGEPQFYNTVFAAVRRRDGSWNILKTPDRPLVTRYQRRSIMAFLLSVLVALPVAYIFARQLTAPIRRFADAAERVGSDNAAPAVPAEGSTELRLAAEALTKMQHRIRETMAERTAMIGAIAHDLRTPLTRIAFRIEGVPEPVRRAVQADIEQMRAMVEATIGFIRYGNKIGDRAPVDLHGLADRIAMDARAMGHAVGVSGESIWVDGDSVALERMIQNLVDNAINYAGAAELAVEASPHGVLLTVADRGPGVDESLIEEVFKPFNRGDPSRSRQTGGLGLGLALARLIAAAHGGSISGCNRSCGGFVVTASLPPASAALAAVALRSRSAPAAAQTVPG